jgi:hypothetical protein
MNVKKFLGKLKYELKEFVRNKAFHVYLMATAIDTIATYGNFVGTMAKYRISAEQAASAESNFLARNNMIQYGPEKGLALSFVENSLIGGGTIYFTGNLFDRFLSKHTKTDSRLVTNTFLYASAITKIVTAYNMTFYNLIRDQFPILGNHIIQSSIAAIPYIFGMLYTFRSIRTEKVLFNRLNWNKISAIKKKIKRSDMPKNERRALTKFLVDEVKRYKNIYEELYFQDLT